MRISRAAFFKVMIWIKWLVVLGIMAAVAMLNFYLQEQQSNRRYPNKQLQGFAMDSTAFARFDSLYHVTKR